MRKNFEMERKAEELMKGVDETINTAFKASGIDIMDMIEGLDETTGAMIGGYMKMLKKAKEFTTQQSKALDYLVETVQDLKEHNEILSKNQAYLQERLQDLTREVTKLREKGEKAE